MANVVSSQPVYNQSSDSNPFAGTGRLPGETDQQYQQRLYSAGVDANTINKLITTETNTSQTALDKQTALQKQRLGDLADLLTQQNKATFNTDIPGIANTSQKAGMLETSGFGQALGQDYTTLQQQTDQALAKQALSDRDLEINGVGTIASDQNALATAGAQRGFSVNDTDKANQLALQLGQMGIPAPAQGPSQADTFNQYAQGAAALLPAATKLAGVASTK